MSAERYFNKIDKWQIERQKLFRTIPRSGLNIRYLDKNFIVLPNVFIPFLDSEPLVNKFYIKKNEVVLDVGTGCGVIAIFAAYKGASKIIAVDISPDAIKATKKNIKLHKFSDIITARYSNIFSQINANEKFDVITANLPMRNKHAKNITETSMWDSNLQAHKKLAQGAKNHLKKNGRIYLSQSNFGAMEEVINLFKKEGFKTKTIGKKHKSKNEIFYALEIKRR